MSQPHDVAVVRRTGRRVTCSELLLVSARVSVGPYSDQPWAAIAVSAATTGEDQSLRQSFGWHVLNTLTDYVELRHDPTGRTIVEFSLFRDPVS